MEKCFSKSCLVLSLSLFVVISSVTPQIHAVARALSTDSRWIVDENGQRVKLACVNWVAHLDAVVVEGLSKQPMDVIAKRILSMGFNCVRFTWPLYLATNDSLASITVRQSFQSFGLLESVDGVQANNPGIIDLSLIKAYQAVVSCLGKNNLMVILDNHISKPGWCCNDSDGNGFFGDQYFDPDLWIEGLTFMATMFKGVSNVVGMSLRNELRGPKQNVDDWYIYMQEGAEAVHKANPDVLVILSGLSYDTGLQFLQNRPVNLSFVRKLVFEAHWYAFTDGQAWKDGNPNEVCGRVVDERKRMSGFLLQQGFPLFVSEFGIDERGGDVNEKRYINCFIGVAAEFDFDWALWTLVGSYDLREGVKGMEEYYGVLSSNWHDSRNSSFLQRLHALQAPFQGPGLQETEPHLLIFHPLTGLCARRKSLLEPLILGPCTESDAWEYTPRKTLSLKGTNLCLQGDQLSKPAKLGLNCRDSNSMWELISDSKMQLSTEVTNGTTACLDVDSDGTVITNNCECLSQDNTCDPGSQWFKLVNSTRSSRTNILSRTSSDMSS